MSRACSRRARTATGSPCEQDLTALSGGITPDRIFTSVLLPAPLSPISAVTLPGVDREVGAPQHLDVAVALADPACFEQVGLDQLDAVRSSVPSVASTLHCRSCPDRAGSVRSRASRGRAARSSRRVAVARWAAIPSDAEMTSTASARSGVASFVDPLVGQRLEEPRHRQAGAVPGSAARSAARGWCRPSPCPSRPPCSTARGRASRSCAGCRGTSRRRRSGSRGAPGRGRPSARRRSRGPRATVTEP